MPFDINIGSNENSDLIKKVANQAHEIANAFFTPVEDVFDAEGTPLSPNQIAMDLANVEIASLNEKIAKNPEKMRPYILNTDIHVSADEAIRTWTEMKEEQEKVLGGLKTQEQAYLAQIARMKAIESSPSDAIMLTIKKGTSKGDVKDLLKKVNAMKTSQGNTKEKNAFLNDMSEKLQSLKDQIDTKAGANATLDDMHIVVQISEMDFLRRLNLQVQNKDITKLFNSQDTIEANGFRNEIVTGLNNEAKALRDKGHTGTAEKIETAVNDINKDKSSSDTAQSIYKNLDFRLSSLSRALVKHQEVSHGFRNFLRNALNKVKGMLNLKQSQAPGIENVKPENLVREKTDTMSFAFNRFKEVQKESAQPQNPVQPRSSVDTTVYEDTKPKTPKTSH